MTAGWGSRTLRAAVFAAVCVLLAALGHVLMSGSAVAWWTLAAGALVTGGAGWCLTGRERGLPLVVGVVAVAQGALHSAFSFTRGSGVRGISRPTSLTARLTDAGADALTLDAEFSVDRDQFGLGWNQLGMIRGRTTVTAGLRFTRAPA